MDEDIKLAELALKSNLITREQLVTCLREQAAAGKTLAQLLVEKGLLTREQLDDLVKELPGRPATLRCRQCAAVYHARVHPGKRYKCKQCGGEVLSKTGTMTVLEEQQDLPAEVHAAMQEPRNRFGKYVLLKMLGQGGMGEVWKAWDGELKRFVAVKFLQTTEEDDLKRFLREASLCGRLNHPNIVALHEVGQIDGKHFIAMQYIEGETLRKKRLTLKEAIDVIRQVCAAIDYAHQQGVVHRDIKPGNIMITPSNWVYVMDFGLAKQMTGKRNVTISRTGLVLGTPGYMSPEQARGNLGAIDARSDVFSLGATLYYATVGRDPFFDSDVVQMIRKILEEDPPSPVKGNPRYPPELENIIFKAMEKEPARRYQTAAELSEDLRRFLDNEPVSASGWSLMYVLSKQLFRRRWQALGALALLLTFAALAVIFVKDQAHRKEIERKDQQARELEQKREALRKRKEEAHALLQKFDDQTYLAASPLDEWMPLLDQASAIADELQNSDFASAAYLLRARCLFRRQNFEAAYEEYTKSIVKAPSPDAYYERGMAALNLYQRAVRMTLHGKRDPGPWKDKAVSDLRESAKSKDISEFKAKLADAAVAYGEDRHAESIRLCDAIIAREKDPKFLADVWKIKGFAHEQLEDLDAALQAFLEAAALRRSDYEAHHSAGSVRTRRVAGMRIPVDKHEEELNQAIKEISTALRINPAFEWAYYTRGFAYEIKAAVLTASGRDPSEAVTNGLNDLERAVKGPFGNRIGSSAYNSMGNLASELAKFRQAAGGKPRSEYERCIALYRQGLAKYSKDPLLWRNLAANLYEYAPVSDDREGTLQQALDAASNAISTEKSADALNERGRIHHALADASRGADERRRRLELAQADFEEAVRLEPRNGKIVNSLGTIYAVIAQTEKDPLPRLRKALDCFSESIQLGNLRALINRGNCYYQIAGVLINRGDRPVEELKCAIADWQEAIRNDAGLRWQLGAQIHRAKELISKLQDHRHR